MVFLTQNESVSLTQEMPLKDYVSCKVSEEINGDFSADLVLPIKQFYVQEIVIGKKLWIDYTPYENDPIHKRRQAFYVASLFIDDKSGTMKIHANHVSTKLKDFYCIRFTATNDREFVDGINMGVSSKCPFDFHSDVYETYYYNPPYRHPRNIRDLLFAKNEPSFLSLYGGEAEINSYDIYMHPRRGTDRGVVAYFGKNIEHIAFKNSSSDFITSIFPYYESDSNYVILDPSIITIHTVNTYSALSHEKILNMTSFFNHTPSRTDLQNEVDKWITNNIQDEQTGQIDMAFSDSRIETRIGDDIRVVWPDANIDDSYRIIKTVFDCKENRYTNLILGHRVPDLPGTILRISKGV